MHGLRCRRSGRIHLGRPLLGLSATPRPHCGRGALVDETALACGCEVCDAYLGGAPTPAGDAPRDAGDADAREPGEGVSAQLGWLENSIVFIKISKASLRALGSCE